MLRTLTTLAALTAALAIPMSAQAVSPLLSGYGGPGSGDQTILSSTVVPPHKHTSTGRSTPPPLQSPARTPVPAATTTAATPTTTSAPPKTRTTAAAAPSHGSTTNTTAAPPQRTTGASHGPTAAPTVAATPSGSSAGFPLSRDQIAWALLGLVGLVSIGVATGRVSRQSASAAE